MFNVAGRYSTTRELQGQRHNMLPRATYVGAVAFAIERKRAAATAVEYGSPTEAAPGLQNAVDFYTRLRDTLPTTSNILPTPLTNAVSSR